MRTFAADLLFLEDLWVLLPSIDVGFMETVFLRALVEGQLRDDEGTPPEVWRHRCDKGVVIDWDAGMIFIPWFDHRRNEWTRRRLDRDSDAPNGLTCSRTRFPIRSRTSMDKLLRAKKGRAFGRARGTRRSGLGSEPATKNGPLIRIHPAGTTRPAWSSPGLQTSASETPEKNLHLSRGQKRDDDLEQRNWVKKLGDRLGEK